MTRRKSADSSCNLSTILSDDVVCVVFVQSSTPETLVPSTVTSVDCSVLICASGVRKCNTEHYQFTERRKFRRVCAVIRILIRCGFTVTTQTNSTSEELLNEPFPTLKQVVRHGLSSCRHGLRVPCVHVKQHQARCSLAAVTPGAVPEVWMKQRSKAMTGGVDSARSNGTRL